MAIVAYNAELTAKIVELRQAGHTWKTIDKMLFPDADPKTWDGRLSGGYCQKHRKAHPACEAAFEKAVIGVFTPVQIVIPLRKFAPPPVVSVPVADENIDGAGI